ncbi:CotO family spore coat protein [Neobacillus soli]|uniref:CotO family spore coat protein n=1 Tax=Neobacillus soli TaxID=220688 RepID=UPI000825E147|nr:CotO family spore coat protein [Neobacillus soli]
MSKKRSQGPLLYVNQPLSGTSSNNNMQEVYTSKLDQEKLLEEKQQVKAVRKKHSPTKQEIEHEAISVEEVQSSSSTRDQEKHRPSFSRVKPFKEMKLNERLDYLINFPKVLPPVPCVFYTIEKSYQGYLTKYDEDQVTIKFHDQTSKTLPVGAIKDVLMIGIKNS